MPDRRPWIPRKWATTLRALTVVLFIAAAPVARAETQQVPSAPSKPASSSASSAAELTTKDTEPTFKLRVQRNLVVVRVVVRDSKGHAVGGLKQQDFRLFDNKKPQLITHFSEETVRAGGSREKAGAAAPSANPAAGQGEEAEPALPQRYLALYFDDVHMKFDEIVRVRQAAEKYLASSLKPGDEVGVFTASGQHMLDFTADRTKLDGALEQLFTRPVVAGNPEEDACPTIYPYQAYQIVMQHDPVASDIANQEAYQCLCLDVGDSSANCQTSALRQADSAAFRILELTESQTQYDLRGLEEVVQRLAFRPGERSVVLVSPGFLTLDEQRQVEDIADRALRSNVVISALDSRGLYAPVPLGDASHRVTVVPTRPDLVGEKAQISLTNLSRNADVMRDLAADTGGVFFENNNDFDQGFRETSALPAIHYVLAFTPENLKLDGRFHTLKVALNTPEHYSVQARRGYFAPTKGEDATTLARDELEQAIFSEDVLSAVPLEVHTQFFKADNSIAKLSVIMHLDVRFIHFRKEQGRNVDNLTVVTALFDPSGQYVTGKKKTLEFHLRDATLAKLTQSGLDMKTSFDVKPGSYLVRQVVQDSESDQLSALNRSVEIP